ncbi:glycoside hydrolase family 76 protein [Mycena maculata]|uniref:Glycoside hydrolase family 76 protein n=1 Tax=Mycena maculata TaxID=230809 RepID=A0AAD7IV72_9AGAR|nr:glycoside hydrolase family 76 protein [Mycena maculata]
MSLILPLIVLLSTTALVDAACQKHLTAAQISERGKHPAVFVFFEWVDVVGDDSTYATVIDSVFNGQETYLTTAQSFDDVQWVVLAYLFGGNTQLDSTTMYCDIASAAVDSSYCGGGLFWNRQHQYKNAITNELHLATSSYLYDYTQNATYLNNLNTTWTWLKASQMFASNGLFDDGLTNDGTCSGTGTQWTYNQGVVLVGLAYLYKFTQDEQYLTEAYDIVDATISTLTTNETLRDSCETNTANQCNANEETFKGIAVFFVARFLEIGGTDNGSTMSDFIKAQADSMLANAVVSGSTSTYGSALYAAGSSDAAGSASAQSSALGALVAAAQQSC